MLLENLLRREEAAATRLFSGLFVIGAIFVFVSIIGFALAILVGITRGQWWWLPIQIVALCISFYLYLLYKDVMSHFRDATEPQIEKRLKVASENMRKAMEELEGVQEEISSREKAVRELREKAETFQKIVEVNADVAQHIGRLVAADQGEQLRAEMRRSTRQNLVFFGLGLLASIPIGVYVNHIS